MPVASAQYTLACFARAADRRARLLFADFLNHKSWVGVDYKKARGYIPGDSGKQPWSRQNAWDSDRVPMDGKWRDHPGPGTYSPVRWLDALTPYKKPTIDLNN